MQKYIPTFFKGLIMGATDIIPGVSGGTMALILGIYEQLLTSLATINIKKPFQTINWSLFIPLGLGIISAIFLLSNLLHTALTQYTGPTYAFFFGLIVISGLLLLRKITTWTPATYTTLILGVIFAYLFIGLNPLAGNHSLPTIFASGAIAIMAMMLPGISGSFLLLLLGQYEYVLEAINNRNIIVLGTLALGCLLGLLAFARLLHYLLKHYHNATFSFLIGMIFGSLRLPVTNIVATKTALPTAIFFGFIGIALVATIEHFARRRPPTSVSPMAKH